MRPLDPSAMHARKRPVAIAMMFAAELAWALVVATPVHEWAKRAWGAHPDGDAVLFAPGGRDLLMWLGQEDAGLSVTARTTLVLLVVGAVLLQLPFGALVASLAFGREVAAAPSAPPAGGEEEAPVAAPVMRSLRLVTALKIGVGAWLPLAALLDGCLQAAGVLGRITHGLSALPIGFGRVEVAPRAVLATGRSVTLEIAQRREGDAQLVSDLFAFDEEGPLLEVEGYRAQVVRGL